MLRKTVFTTIVLLGAILLSCYQISQTKRQEYPAVLALQDGSVIQCKILDIDDERIIFRSLDKDMGYRYGESIPVFWVKYILTSDGSRYSVEDYVKYVQEGKPKEEVVVSPAPEEIEAPPEKPAPPEEPLPSKAPPAPEMEDVARIKGELAEAKEEIERLKRELEEKMKQEFAIAKREAQRKIQPAPDIYAELSTLVLEAGVGGSLLIAAEKRKDLSPHQIRFLKAITNSPHWKEKRETLKYLSDLAEKSLYRVYLYNPQDLRDKLGLSFNPDEEMDFLGLMRQLHRKLGTHVRMKDFRVLVQVVGEPGAKAIKDLLADYQDWLYIIRSEEKGM